jgi:cytochrome c oxidase subunit I+III
MFIVMVGDGTAFASLVFGYFFFWTIHDDFTASLAGPGAVWPLAALGLFALAWAATLSAREVNRRGGLIAGQLLLVAGSILSILGCAAALAGPYTNAMDPAAHVYPAMVWILVIWTAVHGAVGILMQLYCLARSLAGRLTAEHDMELHNVTLYWHFMLITALVTFSVVGLFPKVL